MPKSSTAKRRTKHTDLLPYRDFPLSPHKPTQRWYKVIRGRRHYFGKLGDWKAALEEYQRVQDYLQSGRTPPLAGGGLTLRDLVNRFLTAKQHAVAEGGITLKTFRDYHQTCGRLIAFFRGERVVSDLRPEDFAALRPSLAKVRGPTAMGTEIQRIRTAFKWAFDSELLEKPVRFGPEFKKPSQSVMRRHRAEKPARMFQPAEIKKMLAAASVPMKAMILLGVNCGMGNTDVSELPMSAVNLEKAILDFPRPKTGIERRATLWPETVKALRRAIAERPTPRKTGDKGLIFVTRFGARWVRCQEPGVGAVDAVGVNVDSVGLEFGKLLRGLNLKQEGVSFYALRHVFETIAGETRDQPAVDRIMGHEAEDVRNNYREWQRDEREDTRLRAVTDHVHQWLFAGKSQGAIANAGSGNARR